MTQPALARQVGDDRLYTISDTVADLPSITTAIGCIEKNLQRWSAKCAAEYAVLEHGTWVKMDPNEAVKLIAAESDRRRDEAGRRGDRIHDYLEARAYGKIVPLPKEDLPWKQSADQFIEQWVPAFTHAELTVVSETHGYAGTGDLFDENFAGYGATWLDYKSGKGMYDTTQLQLEALANADYGVNGDGEKILLPPTETIAGVHITPDGAVVRTFQRGTFDIFLAALAIWKWKKAAPKMVHTIQPPKRLVIPAVDVLDRITLRATALREAGHMPALLAAWPTGLPTPKQAADSGHVYTGAQRDAMFEALRIAELEHLADPEELAVIVANLKALPPDLLAAVDIEARRAGVPNLASPHVTHEHLETVRPLMLAASNESAERYSHLAQHISESGVDPDTVLRLCTERNTELSKLMELEWERAVAICSAVSDTYLAVGADGLTVTLGDTDEVIGMHGGKKAVNNAARLLAERHQLPKTRSADAALEHPVMLALLARGAA